jgi:hypothetical protein
MERPQIYMTKEQAQRLAAITLDALVGAQIESTTDDESAVTGCYVPIDNSNSLSFFRIEADGSWEDQT